MKRPGWILVAAAIAAGGVVAGILATKGRREEDAGPPKRQASAPAPSTAPSTASAPDSAPPPTAASSPPSDDEKQDRVLRSEQIAEARRLAEAYPDDDDALYLVGLVLNEQGDQAQAVTFWERAVRLDPRRADTLESLGRAALLREDYGRAELYLRKALAADPAMMQARLRLGLAFLQQGRMRDAIGLLEPHAGRTPEAHRILGQAYQHLREYPAARKAFEQAIALRPEFAEAHYGLAAVCARLGDGEKAKEHRSLFEAMKSDAQIAGRRARSEFNPLQVTRQSVAHTHTDIGRVHLAKGAPERAEALWRRAAEVDPDDPGGRFHLAVLLDGKGRNAEALALFKEVAEIAPERPEGFFALARALARAGDRDAARAAIERAIAIEPANPEFLRLRAQLGSR